MGAVPLGIKYRISHLLWALIKAMNDHQGPTYSSFWKRTPNGVSGIKLRFVVYKVKTLPAVPALPPPPSFLVK